jgi:hypothetical protein
MKDGVEQAGKAQIHFLSAQAVDDLRSLLAALDEAGRAQDREVVRHGRAWQSLGRRTIAGHARAIRRTVLVKRPNHRESCRIGQRVEDAGEWHVLQTGMRETRHVLDIQRKQQNSNFR